MYQNNNYIKALNRAKQKGKLVSTGVKKSNFKKGSIAIIVSDSKGIIRYGEIVKGRTIFANFKEIPNVEGLTLEKLKEKFLQEESILQAINFIENEIYINKNRGEKYEI